MQSLSWLLSGAAVLSGVPAPHAQPYQFHYDHVLGASLDITVMARSEGGALMAAFAIQSEISRLDQVLSSWRPDAELAVLNRSVEVRPSEALRQVLNRCEHWRRETGGAFDCRVGGPLALWRAGEAAQAPPAASALDAALAAVHSDAFPVGETLRRPSGVQLTVDGLAKGYIIDAALQAARRVSPDVAGLMINVGGDLRCWGRAPEALGWRVGASAGGDVYDNDAAPVLLRVSDKAVAASGRGARDLVIQGCAASHILSPTSGRPVAHTMGAVVLAPNAADADALATAFMVMSPKAAIALADRLDGVEALITSAAGQRHASAGWAHYEVGGDPFIRTGLISGVDAASSSSAVARSFGLDLAYEVPKLDADPYHAPYVAAWITDENHRMVRTLLLLGKKPKWVTENYIWWRRYGRESPALLDTLAKPTRPPGRYTAHWDGADQDGEKVPPGRYLLHIEAAREKGGHTYETVDIDVGATAGTKTLAPRDELGALDVRYGPAA